MTAAATSIPLRDEPTGDAGLIYLIAQGERNAFEQLVRLYQQRVTRLAHRLLGWAGSAEVEDIVQEVFLAVLEKAGGFRGESSVWTWLTTITLNRCRSQARRALLRNRVMSLVRRSQTWEAPATQTVDGDEVCQVVRSAVARLSLRDRELVILIYLENRTASEVAEMLRMPRNTVDVRLHRARRRLAKMLQHFIEGERP